MRVDRDDRYISEKANKDSKTSLKLLNLVENFSKPELIILGCAVVIFLISLYFVLFSSSNKNEPTPLTPPDVNGSLLSNTDNNINESIGSASNLSIGNTHATNSDSLTNNQATSVLSGNSIEQQTHTSKYNSKNEPNYSNETQTVKQKVNTQTKRTVGNTSNSKNINSIFNNDDYTIQLSASSSIENLKKLAERYNITDYQIYETKRDNNSWFVLVKGKYSSYDEAQKVIKSLPSALQKANPWVKSGAAINKEKIGK